MKKLLLLVLLGCGGILHAQTWKYVGTSTGVANASEVDMEISPSGTLFIAYVDSDQSNKVTVKKWSEPTQSWVAVGTAGIGDANVSGLQLQVLSNDRPVFMAKTYYMSQEFLEIYKFNGNTWTYMPIGSGGYNRVDHSTEASLSTSGLSTYLTFYNQYEQETGYSEMGLITVNLDNFSVISPANPNLESTSYADNTSLLATGGNFYVVHDEADMSLWVSLDVSIGGGNYSTYSIDNSDEASKLRIQKGAASASIHTMWIAPGSPAVLRYRSFNGSSVGTQLGLTPTAVTDFDFDVYNDEAFVFFKTASTCYAKKVTGTGTPTLTSISSGSTLAPGTATSLRAEVNGTIKVISYISGGKVFVKETDEAANIEDWDNLVMCEGAMINSSNSSNSIYLLDPNYDHSNITLTASSQNTAIIPNSAVTVTGSGTSYSVSIASTNDVASSTLVDLLFTLSENGSSVGTQLIPVMVNPLPAITFNMPAVDFCENDNMVSLANKATPMGGTWSGNGVVNNFFVPALLSTSSSVNSTLTYSKTNVYGCSSSATTVVTVNSSPVLNVTALPADCEEDNGAASVSISEGEAPYDIYWSNGSTTPLINNMPAGQYFLVVTDDNGCRSTQSVNITTNGITQSAVVTDVSCNGDNTGGINLSVTGNNGPFTYAWSTGATTQDVNNLPAGQYEVNISDASGCTSAGSYTINQPNPVVVTNLNETASTCNQEDGGLAVTITGGVQPYSYQWSDMNGELTGETSSSIAAYGAGAYDLEITDANGCTTVEHFSISDLQGPVVAIDTIITSTCANDGQIVVSNVGNSATGFSWSNGATTQDLSNVGPGTYILEATSSAGCVAFLNAEVAPTPPSSVEICLLTVDTATNTNMVVWEKPVTNGIDHFNIYRETSLAGQYQLIASQAYAIESFYTDPVASPSVRSWRYKISAVDQCGTESELSEFHKTIHLTINQGTGSNINLSWDVYEGFSYPQFNILRHTQTLGWETIQTMPTNLFTYTDTPPTTSELYYLVTVDHPGTCTSTKANDFNSSRSNKDTRYSALTTTGMSEFILNTTQVYPNPSTGNFSISNNTGTALTATLVDATGRTLSVFTVEDGLTEHNFTELQNGVYQVILSTGDSSAVHKLTIRH